MKNIYFFDDDAVKLQIAYNSNIEGRNYLSSCYCRPNHVLQMKELTAGSSHHQIQRKQHNVM